MSIDPSSVNAIRWARMRFTIVSSVLAAAIFLFGCGDGSPVEAEDQTITLDVRVHLLESAQSAALTTTLTGAELELLFERVNEIWSQAGIEWRVASVVREQAQDPELFEQMLRGEAPRNTGAIATVIPRDDLTGGDWDVFFIRELFGGTGGVYFPGIPAVLQAEVDPTGSRGLEGGLPRILAHELGHSLSLQHVPCTAEGNLMAAGCPSGDRTRLTSSQIEAARALARTERPYRAGEPKFSSPKR